MHRFDNLLRSIFEWLSVTLGMVSSLLKRRAALQLGGVALRHHIRGTGAHNSGCDDGTVTRSRIRDSLVYKYVHFMGSFGRPKTRGLATIALLLAGAAIAAAQTDEIQVYDGEIAEPGIFNLTWHNNFTPDGLKTPAFPGGLVNNHNLNGVTEWAYGVTEWFEAGLYLPLYSVSAERGPSINGGKIRFLFAVPHAAERKFFYAANFEFSYNSKHWDPRTYTSEIRPILGWHLKPWDFIINPILDNSWYGGFKGLEFVPATRVAYNLNPKWAVAIEEYADYGQLQNFVPAREQFHQVWGVFDHAAKYVHIEAGVGFGLTSASDKLTLKLILSKDLNSKRDPQSTTAKPPP